MRCTSTYSSRGQNVVPTRVTMFWSFAKVDYVGSLKARCSFCVYIGASPLSKTRILWKRAPRYVRVCSFRLYNEALYKHLQYKEIVTVNAKFFSERLTDKGHWRRKRTTVLFRIITNALDNIYNRNFQKMLHVSSPQLQRKYIFISICCIITSHNLFGGYYRFCFHR